VNVVLNLLFVIAFKQGVAGVGYATVISNIISSGLVVNTLVHGEENFRLKLSSLKPRKDVLSIVLKIGVPAGLQGVIFAIANTVIQSSINSFGSAAVAGSTASQNMESMSFFWINAFNQAATTFISQNYSAKKPDRCRKIFIMCLVSAFLSCGLINVLSLVFHDSIIAIFTGDPEVAAFALTRMSHVMIFQWMAASYEVSGSCLRGMGVSMLPTLLTVFGCVGFRVMWVLLIFPLFGTFTSLMMVYIASWIITGTSVLTAYYLKARKLLTT
ncbi:MAG: MATE family efflux transporter, partial [Oribacterium sp.]|nr:MATE family efflux transporter [Oribacterium sp.]